MTQFEPGDLVLLALPFTGATGAKQRPALVLLDSGDEDLLVARVTTQRRVSEFDVVSDSRSAAGLVHGARGGSQLYRPTTRRWKVSGRAAGRGRGLAAVGAGTGPDSAVGE